MSAIGQQDRTIHSQLPASADWPTLLLSAHLSDRVALNCIDALVRRHVEAGFGDRMALWSGSRSLSYLDLYRRICRLAALIEAEYGVSSGQRVLLRGANSPELVVCWLAVQLLGAIPVTTLSMLRARELAVVIAKSSPSLCICEAVLLNDLRAAIDQNSVDTENVLPVMTYGDTESELEQRLLHYPPERSAFQTYSDDVALIGFTSGTTGAPKATVHFHRDVIAVCEIIAENVLAARRDDVFIGTAPLAFTFGLGGLMLFPLYAGASSVLFPRYDPARLLAAARKYQATICFTVPTFYQRMARLPEASGLSALRLAICSGEALPLRVRAAWMARTGMSLSEFFGSTEMLHAFAGSLGEPEAAGSVGRAFPGYESVILDQRGEQVAEGEVGRFAVRGPTGCRYLDDQRQSDYVQNGWNITGDACSMDRNGNITWHARSDDMIISSGYNIAGIEVENSLLKHPAVAECAVIGEPDNERGTIVSAFVVLSDPEVAGTDVVADLQRHVQDELAPYKYPRRVKFVASLPRNESGKIQRFRLRVNVDEGFGRGD